MEKSEKELENVSGGWVGTNRDAYGVPKDYSVYNEKTNRRIWTYKNCDDAIKLDDRINGGK